MAGLVPGHLQPSWCFLFLMLYIVKHWIFTGLIPFLLFFIINSTKPSVNMHTTSSLVHLMAYEQFSAKPSNFGGPIVVKLSGPVIAWLSGVYVPFSQYCPNVMCPSMWTRKKCVLEFDCTKRLKAHSQTIPAGPQYQFCWTSISMA